jgi:hypothetical protein
MSSLLSLSSILQITRPQALSVLHHRSKGVHLYGWTRWALWIGMGLVYYTVQATAAVVALPNRIFVIMLAVSDSLGNVRVCLMGVARRLTCVA